MAAFSWPRRYLTRFQVYNQTPRFGKGVVSLMLLIRQNYSMREACRRTGIAYSKAFKLIKAAESDLGFQLISGTAGGAGGGGSRLTPRGEDLLLRYLNFEKAAKTSLDALFTEYFPR